jgi:hypothetical protein
VECDSAECYPFMLWLALASWRSDVASSGLRHQPVPDSAETGISANELGIELQPAAAT